MKQFMLAFLFLPNFLPAQNIKPSIVVLGVTHSGQLVSSPQQPAALRAFINRVKPKAILIERSPEEFSKGDFYEFTYEQQFVLVPFAHQHKIPLYPIDWLPTGEDIHLAFGVQDLEVPSFTRNPSGFWGFITFEDSSILHQSLYYAEDGSLKSKKAQWYLKYPSNEINFDFARRLFLYRTFLQCKRIVAAAKEFKNTDTLLVVIGDLHKNDIELNLGSAGYKIINTSSFGNITNDEINKNYEPMDAFAIATFNLLGVQARTKVINQNMLTHAMNYINKLTSPEALFFEIKYWLFKKKISSGEAINKYQAVLQTLSQPVNFTWTGVKNTSRLDSYIDPFGNMTLQQRIHLELAREFFKIKDTNNYNKEKEILVNELQNFKKAMLLAYWQEYVEK